MITTILLIIFLGIIILLQIILLIKNKDISSPKIEMLQKDLHSIRDTFDKRLESNTDKMHKETKEQTKSVQNLILEMTRELTNLKNEQAEILSFTKQLNSLEKVLSSPKQRGLVGEYLLDTILKDTFPPKLYQMQYKFTDGKLVDAIIKVKDKIIPIDSKFPLENYRNLLELEDKDQREKANKQLIIDIKKRIDETSKYIKEEEGTTDFAFMFVPSESLYYMLLQPDIKNETLIEYAIIHKRVVIVSPITLLAYLQTVIQGLKGFEIEAKAQEILVKLTKLNKKTVDTMESFNKLGKSLQTTVNYFNLAQTKVKSTTKEIFSLTSVNQELPKHSSIERPNIGA